jgi:CubicO group peptidase (beta-lactamase class C family)
MYNVNTSTYSFHPKAVIKSLVIAKIIISITLLAGCISRGETGAVNHSATEFYGKLDDEIPSLMAKYRIPGAIVAVIKDGEPVFKNGYGYANVKSGRKMTTDAYCRVESITKSVTAWGVIKLVERGEINLDTPVAEYLKSWEFPESDYPTDKITVRQLLNHTSGLPLGTIGVRYAPTEQIPALRESLTQNALPNNNPGVHFEYSNVGYHILELLIEEVTGLDFNQYMVQEVLSPLGMTHSSFEWQTSFADSIPNGYDFSGNSVPPYVYPEKAAGGLFATVDDIARFVCAGMLDSGARGNVLNQESIEQLYTPSANNLGFYGFAFDSYGFGHLIEELPNGKTAVAHGGQGTGWMTHFHAVPESGDGVVILTNSQRSWPFFAQILTQWAEWNGFKRVGMSIISTGEMVLWAVVGLLIILTTLQGLRIITGIGNSSRSFSPFSKRKRKSNIALFSIFILLNGIYIWAVSQDYIFFTSIFPVISRWLLFVAPAISVLLLLTIMFPKTKH